MDQSFRKAKELSLLFFNVLVYIFVQSQFLCSVCTIHHLWLSSSGVTFNTNAVLPSVKVFPFSLVQMSRCMGEPVTGLAHFLTVDNLQLPLGVPALQIKIKAANCLPISLVPFLYSMF